MKNTIGDPIGDHARRTLRLTINDKSFEWQEEYITGSQIRELGGIAGEDRIFLAIQKPWDDELIPDEKEVNLARPEIEHFYSIGKVHKISLIVNGREKSWTERAINFEQVIILAFGTYDPNPNKAYTVTFDKGPHQNPEGSMVKGDKVIVKDRMIFNVTNTDKS